MVHRLKVLAFAAAFTSIPANADSIIGGGGAPDPCVPTTFVEESFSCKLKNGRTLDVKYSGNNCNNYVADVEMVELNGKQLIFREGYENAQGILINRRDNRKLTIKVWQPKERLTRVNLNWYRSNGTECIWNETCGDEDLVLGKVGFEITKFDESRWETVVLKKRSYEVKECTGGIFGRF